MSIRTELDRIIDEVLDQSSLLDQAINALNGKAAGGSSGITPKGEIEITEDGTYDVTSYASAKVAVAANIDSETWTITYADGTVEEREVALV